MNGDDKSPRRHKSAEKAERMQSGKSRSAVSSAADSSERERDAMRPEIEIWYDAHLACCEN